jgi:REP element-mobilizing transposase RayT
MSGGWGRRSIQLAHFDYTRPGAYFVTICAYHRLDLFGSVEGGRVALWPVGEVVREEWLRTAIIRPEVGLDEFVIMPDHIHGIIVIRERFAGHSSTSVGAHRDGPLRRKPKSLGSIVSGFKGAVTRRARQMGGDPELRIWQRNYYDRIIGSEAELNAVRRYIRTNPERWKNLD